jgi:hypothetical protein
VRASAASLLVFSLLISPLMASPLHAAPDGGGPSDAGLLDGWVLDADAGERVAHDAGVAPPYIADAGHVAEAPVVAPKTSAELLELLHDLKTTAEHLTEASTMAREAERVAAAEKALEAADTRVDKALALSSGTEALGKAFRAVCDEEEQRLAEVVEALRQARGSNGAEEAAEHLIRRGRKALSAGTLAAEVEDPEELDARIDRLEQAVERYNSARLESWVRVAQLRFASVRSLNAARTDLSRRLPSAESSALRRFSRLLVQNLQLDAAQVGTALWLHLERRRHDVLHLGEKVGDAFKLTSLLVAMGEAFLLLLLAAWLFRVTQQNKDGIKRWLLGRAETASAMRYLDPLVALLFIAAAPAFFATVSGLVGAVLRDEAPQPETLIIVEAIGWGALYVFLRDALQLVITRVARRHHTLDVRTRLKILRTVRLGMRYSFATIVGLVVAGQIVGTVVVAPVLRAAFVLGGGLVIALLAQRWREEVVTEYAELYPEGRLKARLEKGGRGPIAFAFLLGGLVVVVVHGAVVLARDFVLDFEQTRRAISFVFRLRMQQSAEGRADKSRGPLPEALVGAFDLGPTTKKSYLVDRFEGFDKLKDELDAFPRQGNAMLLYGEQGIGRTTWLLNAKHELNKGGRCFLIDPVHRIHDAEALCAWLGDVIAGEDAPSIGALAEVLNAEPRIILLDGLERLFLRHTDGMGAVDALFKLMHETRQTTLWVLSCTELAWRYLQHARDLGAYFDVVQRLSPWNEEQVRSLILRRVNECGVPVSFEELLVKDVEGMESSVQVVANQDGFIRLLRDFSEGNPRVALHYWLESLEADGEGVIVRLYESPSADALEQLPDDSRFVLQSVVLHGRLTALQAARSLWMPLERVEGLLASCGRQGICTERDNGEIHVDVHWFEATKRFLRRKNLWA